MYTYKSRVAFLETPNGVRTTFTTTESFLAESLLIVQGAVIWTDFSCPDANTVEFGAAPLAPADAGTLQIAVGLFGSGDPTYPVGLWDAAAYRQERGLTGIALTNIIPALTDADARIQWFITVAAYQDALLTTPTDPLAQVLIKKAIGDLAMVYLRQQNQIAPTASTYSESYSGILSYSIGSSGDALKGNILSEGEILNTLLAYQRTSTFTTGTTWGTGRFIGVISTETEE